MARSDHARGGEPETEATEGTTDPATPTVNSRTVTEDRTVFTEDGNADGWIATDLTVDVLL